MMTVVFGSVSQNCSRSLSHFMRLRLVFSDFQALKTLGWIFILSFLAGEARESSTDCGAPLTYAVSQCSWPDHGIEPSGIQTRT